MMEAGRQRGQEGVLYVKLGPYLETLENEERLRPEAMRREVPTMKELAQAAGITPVSLSRLVRGKIKSLNFDTGAAIIAELRRRGFDTDVDDILAYAERPH